jgi:hypothetical protein
MASIQLHPSLQLAHAVLNLAQVLLHEDHARDFDVCSFSNCREQGLMIRAGGGFRLAFAQHRISDEIVTYYGTSKDFDSDHKPIEGAKWEQRDFEREDIYGAARYVADRMIEAGREG